MFTKITHEVRGKKVKIVFPEGMDDRIVEAVSQLKEDDIVEPIVLGVKEEVLALAKKIGVKFEGIEIIDPKTYEKFDVLLEQLVDIRKGKNTAEELGEWLCKGNYFGTMLVKAGLADGLVGGATYSTADTVRPSLQIVKTKPGVKSVSSSFVMARGGASGEKYIFSDCAIVVDPTSEQLAEIAVQSAETARVFGIDPKVAMLSFSTKGSAKSERADKVVEATKVLDEMNVDFEYDGELQFDAAFVESVGQKKAPESNVAGKATVFIFPSLEAGNIGYKIAQRLGNFEAVGPILQGLAAPINDLSRGCSVEDVYNLTLITASQALQQK